MRVCYVILSLIDSFSSFLNYSGFLPHKDDINVNNSAKNSELYTMYLCNCCKLN